MGLFSSIIMMSACEKKAPVANVQVTREDSTEIWYCPMHPFIIRHHPGKCPEPSCRGMELVKKEDGMEAVMQPVNKEVLSLVKTAHPMEMVLPGSVKAEGFVEYDNRTKRDISSRFTGRIEKLFVRSNYEFVNEGQPLFSIYSPEMVTLQENLVFLLQNNGSNEMLDATREKLRLFGFNTEQLEQLEATQKVNRMVIVKSRFRGHIHEKLDEREAAMLMGNRQQGLQLSLKEGTYVKRGQVLFNVVNPEEVYVILKMRSGDLPLVKNGSEVNYEISDQPGMKMKGRIEFIEPAFRNGSALEAVRISLENTGHKHKVGSLVKAEITGDSVEGLWIPASAVIDLGLGKMVWLKRNGNFIAHKIETGETAGEWVEVYDGLNKRDEFAIEGHYLGDSESFLKTGSD